MNYELNRINNIHYKLIGLEQEVMALKSYYIEQFKEKEITVPANDSEDIDFVEILDAYHHILTTTQDKQEYKEEIELLDFLKTLLTDKEERDSLFASAREMGYGEEDSKSWWKYYYRNNLFKSPTFTIPYDPTINERYDDD